ncbi:MAG: redox-regulated ATPase YchF [Chloroflexaceae bacterium]|nr:redox-regulated ATPase YchF [Chloroflexaceae bacterium]
MHIAIIGLANSGKTTVFNALTGAAAETASYSAAGHLEPNRAVVKVPDARLSVLTQMFRPRKTVEAEVQYVDVAGISHEGKQGSGLPPALLNYLSSADALLHVVRAFEDERIAHPDGSVDMARDAAALDLELIFSDLAIIERRLKRLEAEIGKMGAREREARVAERDLLQRLQAALEADTPVRALELSEEEERSIRGYQFLTAKPMLVVLNIGENQIHHPPQFAYPHPRSAVVPLCGKIEAELGQLDLDDAQVFMDDLGITETARERVIRCSYELLGLMSFLTAGPDEVRAWTIRQNTPAVEAAGTIHSDIQRGFIRAEVVAYDDLVAAGGMNEAKKTGTVRMEGKQYIVQDGDVCHFLFNV